MTDSSQPLFERDDEAPLRVLVADDNEHNRLVMQAILPMLNCSVVCAGLGEEAIDLAGVAVFDLIIMDPHMPGMSGDEAAAHIRAGGASRAAFMVRWSTDAPARLDRGLYDADLPKPVRCAAVEDVVAEARRRALNRADAEARPRAASLRRHLHR
jgi:CheY-like chemotaxis protein